jgi:hypothetical protein
MTRPADRRITDPAAPATPPSHRFHGSLDAITDSERRALRSIGTTAYEVAARTSALLADLFTLPSVRIFQGVRSPAADLPRIPHAISLGRWLVLVESVAWPPGQYVATATGRIHCDGVYIGQSAGPLIAAVRHWREALPPGHQVSALVVVHPVTAGDLTLPVTTPATVAWNLAWSRAGDAIGDIRAHLPLGRQMVSMRALAALVAATAGEENR